MSPAVFVKNTTWSEEEEDDGETEEGGARLSGGRTEHDEEVNVQDTEGEYIEGGVDVRMEVEEHEEEEEEEEEDNEEEEGNRECTRDSSGICQEERWCE